MKTSTICFCVFFISAGLAIGMMELSARFPSLPEELLIFPTALFFTTALVSGIFAILYSGGEL